MDSILILSFIGYFFKCLD